MPCAMGILSDGFPVLSIWQVVFFLKSLCFNSFRYIFIHFVLPVRYTIPIRDCISLESMVIRQRTLLAVFVRQPLL